MQHATCITYSLTKLRNIHHEKEFFIPGIPYVFNHIVFALLFIFRFITPKRRQAYFQDGAGTQ